MKKTGTNFVAKTLLSWAGLFVLVAPATAQTWQSLGKAAVIPVVTASSTCNSSTDTVGISADKSTFLTCRSGVWTQQANGVPSCASASTIGALCTSSNEQPLRYAGTHPSSGRIFVDIYPISGVQISYNAARGKFYGAISRINGELNTPYWPSYSVPPSLCTAKGSGWFLPAIEELVMIANAKLLPGGESTSHYWSSTEVDADNAMRLYVPSSGTYTSMNSTSKGGAGDAICIRRH